MMVSPFTPLFFNVPKSDGINCEYIQTFATTDRIFIELIGDNQIWEGGAAVFDWITGEQLFQITFSTWQMNDETKIRFTTLSLNPGYYYVYIDGIGSCEPFKVTDDKRELEDTTLIQYSMKNNRQRRDAVFFIDGMQYFFDFRVPGGFKDSGWQFNIDSEQFETPEADIIQLYGLESTQMTFTLGSSRGVPIWLGEMLNRILVCSHVYFNGEKYCRKDASVPEANQQLEGVNSFVFTQILQKSRYLDPKIEQRNHLIMRRCGGEDKYRLTTDYLREI